MNVTPAEAGQVMAGLVTVFQNYDAEEGKGSVHLVLDNGKGFALDHELDRLEFNEYDFS